jgi:predicted ATPase
MVHDLGEHRLRDLLEPERVFQLVHPDLPADFPPLTSLDAHPTNLPRQPTAFIGREREVAAVVALLRQQRTQLLTLTGSGGTGKTRLALQVAAALLGDFPDGVWFVSLAALRDPTLVLPAIATVLRVREEAGQPLAARLRDYLADKRVLLVLDNVEHLLTAASMVAELLAAAPGLTVLATSRAPLRLQAEQEYLVPPLLLPAPPPPPPEQLSQYEAVRLFIQRAQAVKPDFAIDNANAPAVAEICWRLDGLPLAIELAAARIRMFSPEALLRRLDKRLPLLTGGARDAPERQRTLRDAIAWSHDLLAAQEQTLFRRLAVFTGGATFAAAETVASSAGEMDVLAGLERLVEHSLVRQENGPAGEPRFAMLETIREYGLERLAEAGEMEPFQQAHAAVFLALAEEAEPELTGPQQGTWLERLAAEHDNLRAALTWSIAAEEPVTGLRLAGALWRFWDVRGHFEEGRRWLERVLAARGTDLPAVRAKVLSGAGNLAHDQGDLAQAQALHETALALWRELGDKSGIAASLNNLGRLAHDRGELDQAQALREEALALRRELGDQRGIAVSLDNLGNLAHDRGDLAQAQTLHEESLLLARKLGNKTGIAASLNNLGNVAHDRGDLARAAALHEESLLLAQELGHKWGVARSVGNLGTVARAQGDLARAQVLYEKALALRRELGDKPGMANSLSNLADLAHDQGDLAQAQALYEEALVLGSELGDKQGIAGCLEDLAAVAQAGQRPMRAARLFGAAAALREAIGAPLSASELAHLDRRVAEVRSHLGESAYAAAWAAGRALSWQAAVSEAMAPADEVTSGMRAAAT